MNNLNMGPKIVQPKVTPQMFLLLGENYKTIFIEHFSQSKKYAIEQQKIMFSFLTFFFNLPSKFLKSVH